MNSVAKDVKDYLVAQSVGTYALVGTGWGIYIGKELPESLSSIKAITLRDIGGPKPGYTFNKSQKPFRFDGLQVRVRASAYDEGYEKMVSIAELLDQRGSFRVGTVRYDDIQMTGGILPLDFDAKNRPIFVSTWQAFRQDKSAYS